MVRVHHQAPKVEKPKNMPTAFDFTETSSVGAVPQEAPPKPAKLTEAEKSARRAKKAVLSSKGRAGRSISSESKTPNPDESPYQEMTIEAAEEPKKEREMPMRVLEADVKKAYETYEQANQELTEASTALADRQQEIAEQLTQPGKKYDAETMQYLTHAILTKEGLLRRHEKALQAAEEATHAYSGQYAEWEKSNKASAEMEAALDDFVAKNQPSSATFTEQEQAWFKKGEEEERQMTAAREEIERVGGQPESMIETLPEVNANVAQVKAMIRSGEINNPRLFDVGNYKYLLTRKAEVDRELETAGWWQARELRKELRGVSRHLADYERQIQHIHGERAYERDQAMKASMPEPMKVEAERPRMGEPRVKRGFFARLFGR